MPGKILIIDDEVDTCRMIALGLKLFGYQTDFALSGEKGLSKIKADTPDLLILDLMLPDIDGFEITHLLRADPATADLPIIILSATALVSAEDDSLALGASAFMSKPVSIRELGEVIKQFISRNLTI
jgi:DNA-binding response OmpR family regulator